jgi:hypothetical protein
VPSSRSRSGNDATGGRIELFFAAAALLESDLRPVFAERVSAVRQALVGLWTPPESIELRAGPRWDRNAPAFERVFKRAV